MKALGFVGVLALLLACAGNAYANKVSYTGEGTNLKPGQTKGLPVLMGFDLRGKGCPAGPHCFDHAVLRNVDGVSWAYPNCPEILDGVFEFDHRIRVAKKGPHRFRASGASDDYAGDQVEIEGRFLHHGRFATRWPAPSSRLTCVAPPSWRPAPWRPARTRDSTSTTRRAALIGEALQRG